MQNKFVIVRHSTTSWNRQERLQGQTDIEIDVGGFMEASELADKLLPFKIVKIISSDLRRAMQTADVINKKLKVDLVSDIRLRECSFGSLEGLTRAEAVNKYGKQVLKDLDNNYINYDFRRFSGETREIVLRRHQEAIENYVPEGIILIVGHGRGLNTLLYQLGIEPNLKRGEFRLVEISK